MFEAYVTKEGMIFTTGLRIVQTKDGAFELMQKVVAEPGDLLNIEGNLLYNLSRAALGNPLVSHEIDGLKMVPIAERASH